MLVIQTQHYETCTRKRQVSLFLRGDFRNKRTVCDSEYIFFTPSNAARSYVYLLWKSASGDTAIDRCSIQR